VKITAITLQVKNKNRVSLSVDGAYRFSLDIYQLSDLKIRLGNEYSEEQLVDLEQESQFGKLYSRALEYCLIRPHSAKEIRDYLYRKSRPTITKTGQKREGISTVVTTRVYDRLVEKGYINDQRFAELWVENRSLKKGVSMRKLAAELFQKGIDRTISDSILATTDRKDSLELEKIIIKKRIKYSDDTKLIGYLARQGFSYDDIQAAIKSIE
jgi:regulatory protein